MTFMVEVGMLFSVFLAFASAIICFTGNVSAKNIMKVCNEQGYIKNPQMTIVPNPIQIKAGATHTISISFEHLQEIVKGTKVNLELFIGNTMLPCQPLQDFPDVNVGSCEYEIGELFELMKLLGFPCNDSCNLPLPAQTYRMEGGYRLDDEFKIPELIKMMLNMQSKLFKLFYL